MTSPVRFSSVRADGRSDVDVICELVSSAEPEQMFTFDALVSALSIGCGERVIGVPTVRQAVNRSYTRMLNQQARTMISIAGVGYRVATAAAHQTIARRRQRRSDVQLRRGVQVLQNVRWDEMDPNTRAAHEGTLVLMSVLYQQQRALSLRQGRIEEALQKIGGKR